MPLLRQQRMLVDANKTVLCDTDQWGLAFLFVYL